MYASKQGLAIAPNWNVIAFPVKLLAGSLTWFSQGHEYMAGHGLVASPGAGPVPGARLSFGTAGEFSDRDVRLSRLSALGPENHLGSI